MANPARVSITDEGDTIGETVHSPVYRTVVRELRTLHEATLGTTDSRWASFGERFSKADKTEKQK